MKIHHLNCGTLRPVGGKLLNRSPARLACHCILAETDDGLVLVDTGIGLKDMENPKRLGIIYPFLNIRQNPDETALYQIIKMGYSAQDVKHILITHLDPDHTSGLAEFPDAKVHILGPELESALNPANFRERARYRKCHFSHGPNWVAHEKISSKPWFGFDCMREIEPALSDFALIPLDGHTIGHCGVAIKTDNGWFLHAGDTYHHEREIRSNPSAPIGIHLFHLVSHLDGKKAGRTSKRLRQEIHSHQDEITVFCSHDPDEYERLSGTKLK